MKVHNRTKGILATIGAYSIFGLNMVFSKDLISEGVFNPSAFFAIRIWGGTALFWLLAAFLPKEKLDPGDHLRVLLASVIGLTLPQLTTLWGLTQSTPFDASLIASLKPLLTLIIACLLLKEKAPKVTIAGVFISLAGAALLLLSGTHSEAFRTTPVGFALLLANGLLFSLYLVIFRPLICKYSPVTFLKWLFLFAALTSLPISVGDIMDCDLSGMDKELLGELAFVIFFATFLAYFLTPIGQKHLHPTHYGILSYVQLLVSAGAGIALGLDEFNLYKLAAAVLMIIGATIVSTRR